MNTKLFKSVIITTAFSLSIITALAYPNLCFCHGEHKEEIDAITTATPIMMGETLARNAAQNFLNIRANLHQGGIQEWKGAELSPPVIYYCTTGDAAAYCFSVVKDEKDLGYIFTSTDKTRFPIQEFSRSPAPHKRSLESCTKIAQSNLKEGQGLGKPTIIYPPCMGIYFTLFSVLEGEKEVDRIFFCSRGLFSLPKEILKLKTDLSLKEVATETEKSWDNLKKTDFKPSKLTRYCFRYIDNMPVYPYLIFCHPTTTAALLDYWGLRKEDEPREDFIAEVARYMKEERENGMIIYNIPRRIEQIARIRGYRLKITTKCRNSSNPEELITYQGYKKEIDKGCPPILIFPFGPGAGKDLSTALSQMAQFPCIGVGYSSDPSGDYIIACESLFANENEENIVQEKSLWAKTGVTFYNWNGTAGNLIVISISKPERE